MGHLLKIKCVDSRVNVDILDATSVPFILTTVQVPKFSTNSYEADYTLLSISCELVLNLALAPS
jgi:hypothetical protein